jgi:hypothetical protein
LKVGNDAGDTEFENYSVFKPSDMQVQSLGVLCDEVVAWSSALAPLRTGK